MNEEELRAALEALGVTGGRSMVLPEVSIEGDPNAPQPIELPEVTVERSAGPKDNSYMDQQAAPSPGQQEESVLGRAYAGLANGALGAWAPLYGLVTGDAPLGNHFNPDSTHAGVLQGLTFNQADELSGMLGVATSDEPMFQDLATGEPSVYERNRDVARQRLGELQNADPEAFAAGEVTGALPTALIPGLGQTRAVQGMGGVRGVLARVGANTADGAAFGLLSGVGDSTAEDVGTALMDGTDEALVGGAFGLGTSAVGEGIGALANRANRSDLPEDVFLRQNDIDARAMRDLSRYGDRRQVVDDLRAIERAADYNPRSADSRFSQGVEQAREQAVDVLDRTRQTAGSLPTADADDVQSRLAALLNDGRGRTGEGAAELARHEEFFENPTMTYEDLDALRESLWGGARRNPLNRPTIGEEFAERGYGEIRGIQDELLEAQGNRLPDMPGDGPYRRVEGSDEFVRRPTLEQHQEARRAYQLTQPVLGSQQRAASRARSPLSLTGSNMAGGDGIASMPQAIGFEMLRPSVERGQASAVRAARRFQGFEDRARPFYQPSARVASALSADTRSGSGGGFTDHIQEDPDAVYQIDTSALDSLLGGPGEALEDPDASFQIDTSALDQLLNEEQR